jgi:hypothetical protein
VERVNIGKDDLKKAANQGILSEDQAERLWTFFSDEMKEVPSFKMAHILYYLGGLIAIGAMTLFMNQGWELFGGWGIFAISVCYAILGLFFLDFFMKKPGLSIPAGILGAFVTALVPLAVYGLQNALGFWEGGRMYRDYHIYIDWRWMSMELATLTAAILLLMKWKLPFLLMPVALTLWYISMDLTPLLFKDADITWELRRIVSLWFGLAVLVLAVRVDFKTRSRKDFAFWLYLAGLAAFWGGLSLMDSDTELGKFLYLCVNLLLIGAGAFLSRRSFAVFGGMGAAGYIGHLTWRVFRHSPVFPFVLSFVGFFVIWLGIKWQRKERQITDFLRSFLSPEIRGFLEKND